MIHPKKQPEIKTTAIVQLGRYSDIINLLPVARDLAGLMCHPSPWFVSPLYADIFDGVSYVKPLVWGTDVADVNGAIAAAEVEYEVVLDTQVFGNRLFAKSQGSYVHEEWARAGYRDKWGTLPLEFDRRDVTREAELVKRFDFDGRPVVLLCTEGGTQPLAVRDKLATDLSKSAPEYQWIHLDGVRAERVYDMLGLLDHAAALVATDSAILHLAHATATPTYGLILDQPTPWHGTAQRKHWIGSLRHRQLAKNWREIVNSLRQRVAVEAA